MKLYDVISKLDAGDYRIVIVEGRVYKYAKDSQSLRKRKWYKLHSHDKVISMSVRNKNVPEIIIRVAVVEK